MTAEVTQATKEFCESAIPLGTKFAIMRGFSIPWEWAQHLGNSEQNDHVVVELNSIDGPSCRDQLLGALKNFNIGNFLVECMYYEQNWGIKSSINQRHYQ